MDPKFIKDIPFFSQLDDEKINMVMQGFKPKKFKKEDVILKQGEEADGMYIIVYGEVEVEIDEKVIAKLGNNDFFGEIALVTNEPRTATIRVKSDDILTLFLSKEIFAKIKTGLGEDIKREILQRIVENYKGW